MASFIISKNLLVLK